MAAAAVDLTCDGEDDVDAPAHHVDRDAPAGLVVLACAFLIWRDRRTSTLPDVATPVADWPPRQTGRRPALVSAAAMVLLALLVISPLYAVLAAVIGAVVVVLRRPSIAAMTSLALIIGLGGLIVRRQLRYRLVANPAWPAAFDDLHRLGLLVVVLLLAATIVDDGPAANPTVIPTTRQNN
jgi:hypothetical protein